MTSPRFKSGDSPSPLSISVCPENSVLYLIYFRVIYGSELPEAPCVSKIWLLTSLNYILRTFLRFSSLSGQQVLRPPPTPSYGAILQSTVSIPQIPPRSRSRIPRVSFNINLHSRLVGLHRNLLVPPNRPLSSARGVGRDREK